MTKTIKVTDRAKIGEIISNMTDEQFKDYLSRIAPLLKEVLEHIRQEYDILVR